VGATIVAMGSPFLLYHDYDGRRHLLELPPERASVTIGRRPTCDVALPWDDEVSRLHAELVQMGADWVLCDDGLSHNGTFVNGQRVRGRRRLGAGDVVKVGGTLISMCGHEQPSNAVRTRAARPGGELPAVTPAQRRLLAALCRPLLEGNYSGPATNRQLADELMISVDTVKGTLSALFELFGLTAMPQNVKRSALAARALDLLQR
jgi:pSer/pThr/pTyr-binding forkhead associated (FHA) protein